MYGLNSWVVFPKTVQALRSNANDQIYPKISLDLFVKLL